MNKVTRLLHTRYRLNDLERSVNFYKTILGLTEVRRHKSPRGSELVFLKARGSEELIELCYYPDSGPVQVQPDLTHLAFEVESLDAFGQHLAKHGLEYSDGPHLRDDGSGFAFIDAPEGYEIELMQEATQCLLADRDSGSQARSSESSSPVTRRHFLRESSLVAGSTLVLLGPAWRGVFGADSGARRAPGPNEKLNIAIIGVGGRGGGNLASVSSEAIVALCDVHEPPVLAAAQKFPQAKRYRDLRRVFDDAKDFDAVVVSTCEHTHAFAVLPALQLEKHVYCEKPLTHNVWEAQAIVDAARTAKVATQMGTQIHATDNYRRVVELVQSGAIGRVGEVHVWVGRAWGWQSEEDAKAHGDIVSVRERPAGASPIPPGLDWDLWIGPAPYRPFHEVYWPGPKWYRWWDFGNGTMSDLGSHWVDLPWWALKLDHPLTIEAEGPPPHREIAPASMHAVYTYGARGDLPPVTLHWHQGTMRPKPSRDGQIPKWDSGVLFVGDKGMLLADYGKHVLLPEEQYKGFKAPQPVIPTSKGHHAEWVHACKTGEPTTCNFLYAGPLTIANHLGNVAFRAASRLEWNPVALEAKNCPAAAPFLRREYRPGWRLG